jgi:5'-3' exonuclease
MLIYNTKVESLRGMKIALDATCWLRSIQMLKDPYADALGGCSPGLFGAVSKELENIAKLNIQPIFVFDGMVPPLQHQMFQQSPGVQHLENAWTALANNKDAEAQKSFAVATSRINSDICHFVFHFLRSKGYECIRAPYTAGPQLAHMASNNIVQAVLGQPGLLLYGVKKVLLSMDFSKNLVEWVELDYILHQWGINKSQFTEVCLLAGTEYCLTYPFLNLDYFQQGGSNFSFQSAVELIKQMPLAGWMGNFPSEEMKADHVNGYCVCKSLIQHTPVLNMKDLEVEPFTSPVPSDFSTLIGERLPQSVYALLAAGHLSYRLPSVLCTGEWNDRQPPLIDSLEYRALLVELEEYRAKTVGLLTAALPGHFKTKTITSKSYFEKEPRELLVSELASRNWLRWRFTKDDLQAEMRRQNTKTVDLGFCLRWHAHDFQTDGPLLRNLSDNIPDKPAFSVQDQDSLSALVMLMMLEVFDYVSEEGGMTVLGDAIQATSSALLEPVLLALEMMKFGVLNGEPLEAPDGKTFPVAVQYPSPATADAKTKQTMLISRLMSLMPMRLRNDLWSAKVDFDLASFHCLVRAVNRSMRLVTESCLGNVLLKDMTKAKLVPAHSQAPSSDATGVESTLPAFMLPRACLGILVKYMLEYEGKNFEADVRKKFPCAADPVGDLKVGLKFWDELTRIVTAIAEPLGTTDMMDEIVAAGKLLETKRKSLGGVV